MQKTQELLDHSRNQEREKQRDEGDLAEDDQQDGQPARQEAVQQVDHRQRDIEPDEVWQIVRRKQGQQTPQAYPEEGLLEGKEQSRYLHELHATPFGRCA